MAVKRLRFKTPQELGQAAEAYFESLKTPLLDRDGRAVTDEEGRPVMQEYGRPCTFTGLALALGMTRRDLLAYKGRAGFAEILDRARTRCERYAEEALYGKTGATGARFSLANNFGWSERQEIDQTLANRSGEIFAVADLSDEELERRLAALGWRSSAAGREEALHE